MKELYAKKDGKLYKMVNAECYYHGKDTYCSIRMQTIEENVPLHIEDVNAYVVTESINEALAANDFIILNEEQFVEEMADKIIGE